MGEIIREAFLIYNRVSGTMPGRSSATRGAPTLCNARVPEGAEPITRGQTALVIDCNTEIQTCIVKRLEGDQLEI
jgi:hypothetical protein